MDKVINIPLLIHPANWLVVWAVLLIGGFGYMLVHKHLLSNPTAVTE